MGGGVLQLVAYGAQDIYLTGQPQITFWKSVYRRHTNFAIESILLKPNDSPTLGTRIEIPITRNADLLKKFWVQFSPLKLYPKSINSVALTCICNDFAHALIKQIELSIGGQVIDRLYGKWLSIWRNLSEENPYGSSGFISTSGKRDNTQATSRYNSLAYTHTGISLFWESSAGGMDFNGAQTEAYIPIPFWFCKNPGLAIPLVALQYHDVLISLNISNFTDFATSVFPQVNNNQVFNIIQSLQFYGDYVYLDSVERKQFINNTHEYLIEQLQYRISQNQNTIKLTFKNPVKEIIITGQPNIPFTLVNSDSSTNVLTKNNVNFVCLSSNYPLIYSGQLYKLTGTQGDPNGKSLTKLKYYNKPWVYSTYGAASPLPIVTSNRPYLYSFGDSNGEQVDNISRTKVTLKLVINGKEQFSERNLKYFTRKTIWETHKGVGSGTRGEIAVIPFCLNPEEYQPSGAVNFSIINDIRLVFDNFDSTINEQLSPLDIYAVSYNILKITSGMGGVIYSS